MVLFYVLSVIVVIVVLTTQSRTFKNISHIGYVTATISMTFQICFIFFYATLSIVVDDYCGVQTMIIENESTYSYVELYPASISPILDECFFGANNTIHEDIDESLDHNKTVHMQYLLDISLPVNATCDMSDPSSEFIANSEVLSDTTESIDLYLALIEDYLANPHTVNFDATQISSIVQPIFQLAAINAQTNYETADKSSGQVCEGRQDTIVDNSAEWCTTDSG
jgi:hypothetical protein